MNDWGFCMVMKFIWLIWGHLHFHFKGVACENSLWGRDEEILLICLRNRRLDGFKLNIWDDSFSNKKTSHRLCFIFFYYFLIQYNGSGSVQLDIFCHKSVCIFMERKETGQVAAVSFDIISSLVSRMRGGNASSGHVFSLCFFSSQIVSIHCII